MVSKTVLKESLQQWLCSYYRAQSLPWRVCRKRKPTNVSKHCVATPKKNQHSHGRSVQFISYKQQKKKHGQNTSQWISLALEQNTDKQYVVAAAVQNKLCWTGAWLKHKGFDVICPGRHADCTAILNCNAPISEYKQAKSIGQQLGVQDWVCNIRYRVFCCPIRENTGQSAD